MHFCNKTVIILCLNISIAQRLVRKLCDSCKTEEVISNSIFPSGFEIPKDLKFHHVAVGCEHCYHTGYAGRKAIYEILPIGSELSNLIKNNQLDINEYLEENNIITLKRNALLLIKEGTTSVDEVFSLLL